MAGRSCGGQHRQQRVQLEGFERRRQPRLQHPAVAGAREFPARRLEVLRRRHLFADYLTVTATTDHDSVATVVVPTDRPGVRLVDDWDGFGQRRTGTGTTTFTSVDVAPDEVLSDTAYDAGPVPMVQYASLQLYIHAVVAGALQTVVDDTIELLRSRTRSSEPAAGTRRRERGEPATQPRSALHNPVAYKARVIGQNLLHGSPIPANAYF